MKLCWNGAHGPMAANAALSKRFGEWRLKDYAGRDVEPERTIFADDETGEIWCLATHRTGGAYTLHAAGSNPAKSKLAIAKIDFGPDTFKLVWEPISSLCGSVWQLRVMMLQGAVAAEHADCLMIPGSWTIGGNPAVLSEEGRAVRQLLSDADRIMAAQHRADNQLDPGVDHLALTLAWLEHMRLYEA